MELLRHNVCVPRKPSAAIVKVNAGPRTKICSISLSDLPIGSVEIDSGTVRLETSPPAGVTVFVNEVPSSYLDLADPAFLAFEYFQQMDVVLDAIHPAPAPVRALHLGAAGCSLARAWAVERPDSRQVAVDIDAMLVRYMREWFDLPTAPALRLRAQSAQEAVASAKPDWYDVVVRDVFSGDTTPPELTTLEFEKEVARILKPGGLYLANCADRAPLKLARQELKNLGQIFPQVGIISENSILNGKRYGNLVLAAYIGKLDDDDVKSEFNPFATAELARKLRSLPTPARIITGPELNSFRN